MKCDKLLPSLGDCIGSGSEMARPMVLDFWGLDAQVWRETLKWPIGPGFICWVQNINFSFLILSLYINLSPLESVYVTIKAYFNQNIIHHRISRYLQKAKNNVTGAFLICAEMF